jgi:hypothetical protein
LFFAEEAREGVRSGGHEAARLVRLFVEPFLVLLKLRRRINRCFARRFRNGARFESAHSVELGMKK